MTKTMQIPDYPKEGFVFVLDPIFQEGKWRAAEIVENGYVDPFISPNNQDYSTWDECQAVCDKHNESNGWDKKAATQIVNLSMGKAA